MLKLLFSEHFRIPLTVLLCIGIYLILTIFSLNLLANLVILAAIALGSYELFRETIESLIKREFALDYIAILAILVSLYTHEFLVASILALMIASGNTLDKYAALSARKSLTELAERIPNEITLWIKDQAAGKKKISQVNIGEQIFVRKGEVIPLDGILISKTGAIDESSITGEPLFADKIEEDKIISGTVNMGDPIVILVTKVEENSTYNKILDLVRKAQSEKSPIIRLADKYSVVFTIVTFIIAGISFVVSGFDLTRVLAVLAIATPCPLIIATPVALLGGVNASAKKRIIIKRLSSLEVLSRISTLIFDKTGTITIGKPQLVSFTLHKKGLDEKEILSIAEAIERNSLHPLAKAVVDYAKSKKIKILQAKEIEEKIGKGISGLVNNKIYTLSKAKNTTGMSITISQGNEALATFQFEDELKEDSKEIVNKLRQMGLKLFIFTGDKQAEAEKVAQQLGPDITIKAECTPEDKQSGIAELKKKGQVIAMIGDGINDAPALALADVGLVFSNEEQTAASEAADVVFLGGNFSQVYESISLSKRTINIALQSIFVGIGLSIVGMVFASFGTIPPIYGAGLQEGIDLAVILNALRAST